MLIIFLSQIFLYFSKRNFLVTSGRGGPVPPLSETALVREVIYSLQGIDGTFLKLDPSSEEWRVVDEPAIGTINKSKKLYMLRFAELGWLHNR